MVPESAVPFPKSKIDNRKVVCLGSRIWKRCRMFFLWENWIWISFSSHRRGSPDPGLGAILIPRIRATATRNRRRLWGEKIHIFSSNSSLVVSTAM
jgi:hypothetical protein